MSSFRSWEVLPPTPARVLLLMDMRYHASVQSRHVLPHQKNFPPTQGQKKVPATRRFVWTPQDGRGSRARISRTPEALRRREAHPCGLPCRAKNVRQIAE